MHKFRITAVIRIAMLCCLAPALPAQTDSSGPAAQPPAPDPVAQCQPPAENVPADSLVVPPAPLVETPRPLRGLYVNRWAAIGGRMWQLINVARRTEINALVIDVKDDRGLVLYPSSVPLAREIGADTSMTTSRNRIRTVLDSMRALEIYPIARIVVAKDPLLARQRQDLAIRRADSPSQPWLDRQGRPWLDPHQNTVWRYAAALACEAVRLGFSEVQFDYVRFPDDPNIAREATYPLAKGRNRSTVIREQLGKLRAWIAPLGVPVAADVFGLTTSVSTDMGIGQEWEMFVDQVDVVLPMTYPSHYAPGSYGISSPNAQPYAVISRALEDAAHRSAKVPGAAEVIPWYQDFTLGSPPYGAAQVRAQIRAGYDTGVLSWILWNPGSRYTLSALLPADTAERGQASDSTPGKKP